MQAYVGDTRSRKLLRHLAGRGVGQVCVRGRIDPRLRPWFYDNGAYEDFKAGRPFDGEQFGVDLEAVARLGAEFLVLPDRVGEREATMRLTEEWLPRCRGLPSMFAVQDGMTAADVPWPEIVGVFVGGTLDWKLRTVPLWRRETTERDRLCHFARCGTRRRVCYAVDLGVDSLDSSLPLWSRENLRAFEDALAQLPLFPGLKA